MIIILQNFDVLPLSINAVPMNELDAIQEWLTDCSIMPLVSACDLFGHI